MKNIFQKLPGIYGSHRGLTDLYEDHEKVLRKAIAGKKDFCAVWGSRHEIVGCAVERSKGWFVIAVSQYIDELHEAVDTLIWEATGKTYGSGFEAIAKMHDLDQRKDEARIDEIMEEVQDWVLELYQEEYTRSDRILGDSSYDDVMRTIDETWNDLHAEVSQCWQAMVDCVKDGIEAAAEQARMPRECRP